MHSYVWGKITYPFPNVNDYTKITTTRFINLFPDAARRNLQMNKNVLILLDKSIEDVLLALFNDKSVLVSIII